MMAHIHDRWPNWSLGLTGVGARLSAWSGALPPAETAPMGLSRAHKV